ncbi:MAG: hypothetical protein K1W41_10785 [Lachnospiraceae bacterium]
MQKNNMTDNPRPELSGMYKQQIIDMLDETDSIQALKFIYGYLIAHIRRMKESRAILHDQYDEVQQGDITTHTGAGVC